MKVKRKAAEDHTKNALTRRTVIKNLAWAPLLGPSVISACSPETGNAEKITVAPGEPDNWYKFCRPILEWVNPHQNLDCEKYVENLIKIARQANVNTVYHLIDFGGSPLFNGSIEPKWSQIGDFDLLGYLEKRLHEEGMYFVAAQFGAHTMSSVAARHPDWVMRDNSGNVIYGPGSVPLMCFNTGYKEYVAEELGRVVKQYKTDGVYIEGLYYNQKNCFCGSCKKKFAELYGKEIPRDIMKTDPDISRFHMDSIVEFIDNANRRIKENSPETVVMACPPNNNSPYHMVDWKKLGQACDIVTLERMWGYGLFLYPIWQQGMNISVMYAESGKTCFTTTWYGQHVDREYTPRTKETMMLNYFGSLIHAGTPQFHTQNALEEAPDYIPVLNELYSYTEKIRPYFFSAKRLSYVSLLYDRDHYWPEEHFSGYYKSLIYNHIPFKVISRDDLLSGELSKTSVLILPNIVRLSAEENSAIDQFTINGGRLIATFKTGFQDSASGSSSLAALLGVKKYIKETRSGKNTPRAGTDSNSPENYRIDWNYYFRSVKGSFADKVTEGLSLMSYTGNLLEIEPSDDARISANTLDIDLSRQSVQHPVYGFYPGKISAPLILERDHGKGKVVYFTAELDKAFLAQGFKYTGDILAGAVNPADLPIITDAPDTVEITYFQDEKQNYLLVHLLNATTNQRDYPDPVTKIFPVKDIKIRIKDRRRAASINGTEIETKVSNGFLEIVIPELNIIDTLIIQ